MSTPRPGKKVRGSTTGVPLMALFDLLGKRWAMRILWELSLEKSSFRELQAACDNISPTSLNKRIKELHEVHLLEKYDEGGYGLTKLGQSLMKEIAPLRNWSKKWAKKLSQEESP